MARYTQQQVALWVTLSARQEALGDRIARNNRRCYETRGKAAHATHIVERDALSAESTALMDAYYGDFTDADYSGRATAERLALMREYRKTHPVTE